jgi:hypothetical protein
MTFDLTLYYLRMLYLLYVRIEVVGSFCGVTLSEARILRILILTTKSQAVGIWYLVGFLRRRTGYYIT